jgi:hypothetical protein
LRRFAIGVPRYVVTTYREEEFGLALYDSDAGRGMAEKSGGFRKLGGEVYIEAEAAS